MKRPAYFLLLLPLLAVLGCGGKPAEHVFTIGFMPKLVGIPYFNACKRGAEQAAQELKIKLDYNGPTKAEANQQIDLLNQWAASGTYDLIAVSCNDPDLVAPALLEARKKGILVLTYDADAREEARQFFVNQSTYEDVARAMADAMADVLEPKGTGTVGILTSSIQAPNQSQWSRRLKAYVQEKYPGMRLLPETEHGEDRDKGITQAKALIQANREMKGIIGLTSVAVPAAAEAVRQGVQQGQLQKGQIQVTGVSTPKDMRDYVEDGTVQNFVLWSPVDLGYLTVHVADLLRKDQLPENGTIQAGRLGKITVNDREVLLGRPIRFTRQNIDTFDF
jgi:ABC-type sugar transport system substrate-binding protein